LQSRRCLSGEAIFSSDLQQIASSGKVLPAYRLPAACLPPACRLLAGKGRAKAGQRQVRNAVFL